MDNSHIFIYSCSNYTYKFHISNLKYLKGRFDIMI